MGKCFLCGGDARVRLSQHSFLKDGGCKNCGRYWCDDFVADRGSKVRWHVESGVLQDTEDLHDVPRHVLSGLTRESSEAGVVVTLKEANLRELVQSASIPHGPLEAMDRILSYVARKRESFDEHVTLSEHDYPIAFAKHADEFDYLISNLVNRGLVERYGTVGRFNDCRLTPEGWSRVDALGRTERESRQAFVAMWFDKSLGSIYEDGFAPALEEVGYRPFRIDLEEHNEKICDKIIVGIRRSGLLVADFTGNRGGVYFEAGFAMGLGIPVIWTCQEGEADLHFDTCQYNHIFWKDSADLRKRLIDRIEATLPSKLQRSL